MKKIPSKDSTTHDPLVESVEKLEYIAVGAGKVLDESVDPIRKKLVKRYPIVTLFLVGIGFVLTSYGVEAILNSYPFFATNPYVTLFLGLGLLFLTGTLYKIGRL